MATAHEIVARLKAEGASSYVDDVGSATEATEEFGDTTEETVERSESAWERHSAAISGAGVAIAGGGAALEGLARKQQDTRAVAGRLANALEEETTDSVMGLASDIHNATTDFDELVGMMETGRQAGITSSEQLQEYAQFWDMVGDASGESAAKLADSSVALQAVGVEAGNESEALAAMGFVARETRSSVGGFLDFVGRAGKELGDNTPHVNDMAAALGALEAKGLDSQLAQREIQQALRETDGDMNAALETLGISQEAYAEFSEGVAASSDVIGENADAFAESRTGLQDLSARLESTMAKYSGLTQAASALSPVMMGVGGAMLVANQAATLLRNSTIAQTAVSYAAAAAKGVWAGATWALNGAIAVLTSPITLVILAIGALVAAGIWAWKNWDTITEKLGGAFRWIGDLASDVWGGITGTIRDTVNGVLGAVNSLIDAFNSVSITLPTIPDWVPVVGGKGGQTIGLPTIPRLALLSGGGSGAGRSDPSSRAAFGMNAGGRVPGRGPDRDSVLAALTPGEWVFSRSAVEGLGEGTLRAIEQLGRRGRPLETEIGQAGGGGRGPATWQSLAGMIGDAGIPHRVTSTVRNRGGSSYHETGHAIDLAGPTPSSTPTPAMNRIFEFFAQYAGGLAELIYAGAGRNVKNGRWVAPYAVSDHRDHVHVAALADRLAGAPGAEDDGSGIPFWARPVLDAIARGFGRAFGVEDASWDGGAYVDRPWRGMARVGEHEAEFVSPESQLARVIDERLAAAGTGTTIEQLQLLVQGDVLDPEQWFDRNRGPMADTLAREIAERAADQ